MLIAWATKQLCLVFCVHRFAWRDLTWLAVRVVSYFNSSHLWIKNEMAVCSAVFFHFSVRFCA